ncbi:MAG: hypothetical protein GY761_17620 [Hyphomicrobiales bacterium]|nr:hypothetical protein [Hyphomicrobiales bacterium]
MQLLYYFKILIAPMVLILLALILAGQFVGDLSVRAADQLDIGCSDKPGLPDMPFQTEQFIKNAKDHIGREIYICVAMNAFKDYGIIYSLGYHTPEGDQIEKQKTLSAFMLVDLTRATDWRRRLTSDDDNFCGIEGCTVSIEGTVRELSIPGSPVSGIGIVARMVRPIG